MSAAFAELFWENLNPRLTRLCVAEARCVAAGIETFGGAFDAVMRYACHYGALHLLPPDLHELEEWIAVNLSTAILEAEASGGWTSWLDDNHIGTGARI